MNGEKKARRNIGYEAAILEMNDFAARTNIARNADIVFYENIDAHGKPFETEKPWEVRSVGMFVGSRYYGNIEVADQSPALLLAEMAETVARWEQWHG